ncbi:hypothetical protein JRO89_XS03G0165100 [Xanthoceras sorbifolium]|uniref:Uncharacterized protein n=1 Tax=Xanthoceras sorbifolium TaxID=99658 RepID=A0ABQ8IAR8_9ROSI|nr:hypothetical protein JRO89_XS03G0165100 [Xanthoceras sorbifolium]
MCGGAIISDFIDLRRGRKLTAEDLWYELDTISDLLGLENSGKNQSKQIDLQFPRQKTNQVDKAKRRCLSPDDSTQSTFETALPPPPPPPPPPYVGFGCQSELYQLHNEAEKELELKEQISSLESFLGLEPTAASQVSGSGECDPMDLWMLEAVVTHHHHQPPENDYPVHLLG